MLERLSTAENFGLRRYRTADVRFTADSRQSEMSYALLILFLASLYSNPALLIPSLEALRPAQLIAALAICALFVEKTITRRPFELVWPEGHLLVTFLIAAGVSALQAFWMRLAVDSVTDVLKFVLISLVIINCVHSERRLLGIAWTMVAGGVFPAAGAIHNYFRGIVQEGRAGWVGIFENPNELAYSLVILIPVAAALSIRQRLMLRIALFAIIGLYLYAIYITFSRGGIIGLAVVLTTLALTQRSIAARAGLVMILVLLFFVVIVYWNRDDGFSNLSQDFTVRQRLATIEAGIAMFFDRPITGVGIGCSIVAWPLYSPTHVQFHGALHNHNTIVQALSETGLLGFIPFGLMFLSSLTDTRRLSRLPFGDVRITALIRAFEVAIYGFLACGMSGGYVLSWFPYILVALVAASKRLSFSVRSHESSA